MKGSSALDAGVLLTSDVITAINHQAETTLVALDIKGAFDSVRWQGLPPTCRALVFVIRYLDCLNHIYQTVLYEC